MDEVVSSAAGTACAPGVAVRYGPARAAGVWHHLAELQDDRLAVAVGRSTDPALVDRLSSEIGAVLRATGDPVAATAVAAASPAGGPAAARVICAVIDRPAARLTYSSVGDIQLVVAVPEATHTVLDPAVGRPASVQLQPATTVLLCTVEPGEDAACAAELLAASATMHPDQAADRIIGTLAGLPIAVVALLYRHAPAPMSLTVPAVPSSLATVRSRLRHWLALTGADSETAADALLAVGEAASNAAEHAVLGAVHDVELTVRAAVAGARLLFTVSDNGCWKTPSESSGHRGHGIRLIKALVDEAHLASGERGTTVEMSKEWRQ